MSELDMSRPGSELFPELTTRTQNNEYQDVNPGQFIGDPLGMGVTQNLDVASQGQSSEKEMNFRALREETAKLQQEREYWKGQAEAYSKIPSREPEAKKEDFSSLDWSEGTDVRKAFESLREENSRLKNEFQDQLAAVKTQAQHSDWNKMVTQHVPELTSKNPIFAEMINRASNPYEAAYLLAELNAKSRAGVEPPQPQSQQMSGYAQRAMQNAQKPQSLNTLGGNGQLSAADYYASMSDEDFHKIASKNMANI
jgi:hypothetical protein